MRRQSRRAASRSSWSTTAIGGARRSRATRASRAPAASWSRSPTTTASPTRGGSWRCTTRWAGRGGVGVGGTVVNGLRRNRFAAASQLVHDCAHAWANRAAPRFFSSNNLALPARGAVELGGFDEGLRFAEDRELCDRWIAAGPRARARAARGRPACASDARAAASSPSTRATATARGGSVRRRPRRARRRRRSSPPSTTASSATRRGARPGTAALVVAAQLANAAGFASAAIADRGRLPRA